MPDKTSAIYAEAFRLESEVKQLREALAAARRALESWVRTYGHGDFEASRLTRVALAAPADGEEGK